MPDQKLTDLSIATLAPADLMYVVQSDGGSPPSFLSKRTSVQAVLDLVPDTGAQIGSTAFGSEPGSPNAGDLDLYSDASQISRYSGSAWVPWGPLFPLTAPINGNFS